MRKYVILSFFTALAVSVGAAQAAVVLIDDFSGKDAANWPRELSANVAGMAGLTDSGISGAIGGVRSTWFGNSQVDVAGFDRITIDVHNTAPHSFFDYRSSAGARAEVEIGYGSSSTGGTALGADWTALTHLRLNFSHYDLAAGGPLEVWAALDSGGGIQLTMTSVTAAGPQAFDIALADFAGATLSSVDGVHLTFRAPNATDFRIDSIQVIPEPAALSLLGLSGLALIRRRRR